MRGRLHSKLRDRSAISHHYDLSNEFYSLILDESMAYSAATGPRRTRRTRSPTLSGTSSTWSAQARPRAGDALLDVGCGWGSLSLHAAANRGQGHRRDHRRRAEEVHRRAHPERGLADHVEIRLRDYRDVTGTFDAVASIEMGEHVGQRNYPTYAAVLRGRVKPGGRVLIQQMSRRGRHPGGGPFIESFIAPDMHMRPVGETVALLEGGGLEVRDVHALREHYVQDGGGLVRHVRVQPRPRRRPGRGGGRARLAALPRRWRHGLPRRADGRRPDRGGAARLPLTPLRCAVDPGPRRLVRGRRRSDDRDGAGRATRRPGLVVDVTWGIGFVLVALVALLVGDGDLWRRWLLLAMVALWGGRLAWHILRRQLAHPEEDPRYAAMLGDGGFALAVRKVFVIQGVAIWFVSLPVQVAGFSSAGACRWSGSGSRCGWSAWSSRRSATPSSRRTRRTRTAAGDGPRPVGLDPAPELLRRRVRVVGDVAHRGARVRLAARAADRRGAAGDDVLPGVRDRRPAAGADHDEAARLPGVRRPHLDVLPAAAEAHRDPGAGGGAVDSAAV